MFRKTSGLVSCLMLVLSATVNAETGVSLSESTIKSKVGETMSVDLLMSGSPNTEGGGIEVHYDPDIVRVNSVAVDESTWTFVNRSGDIDNAAGAVTGIVFSNFGGVSGSAKIATMELEFTGKGKGQLILSGSDDNPFASSGEAMTVNFTPTRVQVRR